MKLAFNTWVYSSFPVWVPAYPIEETIERIAGFGYDGIEIGAASPHAFPDYVDANRRAEIRSCLDANGLALASMLPAPGGGAGFNPASAIAAERAAAIDQYCKVIDLAADLGGDRVLYVAGWIVFGTSRDEAFENSRDSLLKIVSHAADRGVEITIEPTSADSNLIDSADDAIRLMNAVDANNVSLMFDTYHTIFRNEVATDYVHRMGSALKHVHLSDAGREAPCEGGAVDYYTLVDTLAKAGFDGYLTMEIGFDRRAVDPDRMARSAHDYLRGVLADVKAEK